MKKTLPVGSLLGGFSPARFLRDYWHKHPLLIRNAVPGFTGLLSTSAMQDLARRDDVESRLIQGSGAHWLLDHGPFGKSDFKRLPRTDWTLLVQPLNHVLPEADALLEPGFGVALVCNADTLMVTQILWQDQGRREAGALYADRLAGSTLQKQQQKVAEGIKDSVDSVWGPLPIGWSLSVGGSRAVPDQLEALRQAPTTFLGVFSKLVGIVFTALAASLGAPFWFDLLQKATKARSSGHQLLTEAHEPDQKK